MKNFNFLKRLNVLLLLALLAASVASADALIDPSLSAFVRSESQGLARVLILVKGVGSSEHPQRYDRSSVIRYYKDVSRRSVEPLLVSYQNRELVGVKLLNLYWINGAILADVTREGLMNLAKHPSVTKIYKNNKMRWEPGLSPRPARRHSPLDKTTTDYAFPAIGLDKLIQEHPEVTGQGVIVGVVDTGVDDSHPALAGKIPLYYDGQDKRTGPPKDYDTHGTHVSGTIAGGDRQGNLIGVAPGAKVVMAGVVTHGYDAMIEGMQWFLDAEKNPIVANKIRAVGCSWNSGGAPDQEVFYRAIAAWEGAGILPVFSAGNNGPDPQSITHPHEYPGTLAVAAFGADGQVAEFSSRGPGRYKNQDTQKPDLAAPGVDITSSVPGGKYEQMSGTSMAQPHVTGTTALLLQVKPDLNPAQLREILVKSAVPASGQNVGQWSPAYGFGKLNAYNAVKLAATLNNASPTFLDTIIFDSNGPTSLDAQSLSTASLGEVGSEIDQYGDTDSSRWMTLAQILE